MESFNRQLGGDKTMNNKVYVNPNFKRSMHVNPNFSYQSHNNQNKIFINPNFIRLPNPQQTQINKLPICHSEETTYKQKQIMDKSVENASTNIRNHTVTQAATSSSRYSLVRHRNNENKTVDTQPPKMQTIKVNKYKTVSLSDVKKTLETCQTPEMCASKYNLPNSVPKADSKEVHLKILNVKNEISSPSPRAYKSQYKIIKRNKSARTPSASISSICRRNNSITHLSQKQSTVKINRKLLKKNNIPCPLFRKYGKCLRHIQGNCGFLHDKKHVNICRRFIKGMCHNTECPLSHELTVQKMPTCYFFLRGMCTKDGCPYLHVKLNEKAKICPDFLKGYCEKGDNCMDRHINICPNFATKGTCSSKQCPYPHKVNKLVKSKKINKKLHKIQKANNLNLKENNAKCSAKDLGKETADGRYYDTMDNVSTSDSNKIKPIRCKLGTLPSFIEL